MSPAARGRFRDALINALLGMLATLFLLFATGAWSSRESVSDHRADVEQLRASVVEELHRIDINQQRTLDAVCTLSPKAVSCTTPVVAPPTLPSILPRTR